MRFNDPSRFIEEIGDKNYDPLTIMSNKASSEIKSNPFGEPKLLGNFKTKALNQPLPTVDPATFVANKPEEIKVGQKVLHLKFGLGEVKHIDQSMIATILFEQLADRPEKRIVLNYTKLQIVE